MSFDKHINTGKKICYRHRNQEFSRLKVFDDSVFQMRRTSAELGLFPKSIQTSPCVFAFSEFSTNQTNFFSHRREKPFLWVKFTLFLNQILEEKSWVEYFVTNFHLLTWIFIDFYCRDSLTVEYRVAFVCEQFPGQETIF